MSELTIKKVPLALPLTSLTPTLPYRELLKEFAWFEELAKKAYEVWLQGEGQVALEINNSETDRMGKRHRNVIITRTSTVRCKEA